MIQYYLVILWGDIEEEKFGPYGKIEMAIAKARRLLKDDQEQREHGAMIIKAMTSPHQKGARLKVWMFNPFADDIERRIGHDIRPANPQQP
jgi:hypothetical protein